MPPGDGSPEEVEDSPSGRGAEAFGAPATPEEIMANLRERPPPTTPVEYNVEEAAFWQSRHVPPGSVVEFSSPTSGAAVPPVVAVLVFQTDSPETGMWLRVKVLGSSDREEKKEAEKYFKNFRREIHICNLSSGSCPHKDTDAMHLTQFKWFSTWRLRRSLAYTSSQESNWRRKEDGVGGRQKKRTPPFFTTARWSRSGTVAGGEAVGSAENPTAGESYLRRRCGASQYKASGRCPAEPPGWTWWPCPCLKLTGAGNSKSGQGRDGGDQRWFRQGQQQEKEEEEETKRYGSGTAEGSFIEVNDSGQQRDEEEEQVEIKVTEEKEKEASEVLRFRQQESVKQQVIDERREPHGPLEKEVIEGAGVGFQDAGGQRHRAAVRRRHHGRGPPSDRTAGTATETADLFSAGPETQPGCSREGLSRAGSAGSCSRLTPRRASGRASRCPGRPHDGHRRINKTGVADCSPSRGVQRRAGQCRATSRPPLGAKACAFGRKSRRERILAQSSVLEHLRVDLRAAPQRKRKRSKREVQERQRKRQRTQRELGLLGRREPGQARRQNKKGRRRDLRLLLRAVGRPPLEVGPVGSLTSPDEVNPASNTVDPPFEPMEVQVESLFPTAAGRPALGGEGNTSTSSAGVETPASTSSGHACAMDEGQQISNSVSAAGGEAISSAADVAGLGRAPCSYNELLGALTACRRLDEMGMKLAWGYSQNLVTLGVSRAGPTRATVREKGGLFPLPVLVPNGLE